MMKKYNEEILPILKQEYVLSPMLLALRLIKPGSKVLSLGCGAGREVKYLVRELHCKVVALDNDPEMLRLSKQVEPDAIYIEEDISDFSLPEKFDYVICLWNTINYLRPIEKEFLVSRSHIVLKRGGQLILTSSHIFHKLRYLLHNLKYGDSYYYFPWEIDKWFQDLTFKVEKVRVANSNLIVATKL